MHQPLLLLDIDGVISLFGFDVRRPPDGRYVLVDGTIHFLSTAVARLLDGLRDGFELVWCSGWEERADEHLPAALGLPRGLPHLTFAPTVEAVSGPIRHWKLASIDAYVGARRPLAWVDDDHDASCARWAAARPGPTRLVTTDPAIGLTAGDAAGLRAWAGALHRRAPNQPAVDPDPF